MFTGFKKKVELNKKILRLAVPNIITNLTVPLLGMVDMGLMGHMGDEKYIGAIALGGVIFNLLYWSFAFLRMGTSGLTAQACGEEDEEKSVNILARSLFVAITMSLVILLLRNPISWLSFQLIKGSSGVELLAKSYFHIRIFAAPATISLYALTGWFIGMQNARYPMIISILINVLNIGFNALFVFVFDMRSDGVALGTVIAQYSGMTLGMILLFTKYREMLKKVSKAALFNLKAMLLFFKVNRDIFLRTLCIISVFTFFTSRSAATNDQVLAVNSLLLQFLIFFSYFVDGFAYAGEALVGRFYGAGASDQLKRVIKLLFVWGIGLGVFFTLLYLAIGINILQLLTNDSVVIDIAKSYLFWVVMIPILSVSSYIWDGVYIGATASKGMLVTMVLSTFILFFPVYFGLQHLLGNHALWLAMVLFMAGRGIFQTLVAKRFIYSKI